LLFWIRIQEDQNDPRKGKRKEKRRKKEKKKKEIERRISFSFSEELGVRSEEFEDFPGAWTFFLGGVTNKYKVLLIKV
jgi:hypothetical protein